MPQVKLKNLPMKEAQVFWQDKVPMARPDFDELAEQMQAKGFYVSGLHRLDQVSQVQNAIHEAVADGTTFQTFKKRIADIIDQQNWSGVRLEIIFRTNLQSAYMSGRYAQMQKVTKNRPYWMYDAINDSRTRPAHREMDGKIFRYDHPIWNTWYPPNGYRCRCGVTTLSESEMKRDGLKLETNDPTGKLFEPVDLKTGNKMPARPLMPDNGFSGNQGREWLSGLSPTELADKIEDLPMPAICKNGRGMFADAVCKPPLADIDSRHVLPVSKSDILLPGKKPETYVRAFLKEFGVDDINGGVIHRLPCNIAVPVDKGFFIDKKTGKWKVAQAGRAPYMRLLARTILNPYEIWQVPARVAGRPMPVLRLIRLFSTPGKKIGGFAVWNLVGGRKWQAATTFTPKVGSKTEKAVIEYLEKQRKGVLLFREK